MAARITLIILIVLPLIEARFAYAEPAHGIAMHGEPALPDDFESLSYVNPHAPRQGAVVYGEHGRFDSLNPFIVKGRAPAALRPLVFESLMARSWDEPFTVYGLLADRIEVDDARSWVEFTLNPKARFSSGQPVTAEDVIFSWRILRDQGRPNFRTYYGRVAKASSPQTGRIRFDFAEPDRELPLLLGLMPILSKADWEDKDFTRTSLDAPVGSGPYEVRTMRAGEAITFGRRVDYWGHDLPINRGIHNFESITYLYYRDDNALWEAFKAGEIDIRQEPDPNRWENEYTFPAVEGGRILRDEIRHKRATGMYGFVFNTRRPVFADRRVREALTLAFDFEWINAALNRGAYNRITSFYANSDLAFSGPAEGAELKLLEPFADSLPPDTLTSGYEPPVSPGTGRNRKNLRKAAGLLREAGWQVSAGRLVDRNGKQMTVEILLTAQQEEKIAGAFAQTLERLGIDIDLRSVDSAQYQERLNTYDFDMTIRRWWLSLSPGAEQRFYFGSEGVTEPGTRNYMGAKHPAIDAMIEAMLSAKTQDEYRVAVRALDRVLTAGRYVIPLWYEPTERVAWWKPLAKPELDPLYGYRPEVWWRNGD